MSQKLGEDIDDWGYQLFLPDQTIEAGLNIRQCYACHQRSRQDTQFMFTHEDAVAFEP